MIRQLVFTFLFLTMTALADPWGKDADLAQHSNRIPKCPATSPLARIGQKAIRFHQKVISPADGPRSHFIPSSSQYTWDAMQKYGFFKGVCYGCDRLMRENDDPWVYKTIKDPAGKTMKSDPVR